MANPIAKLEKAFRREPDAPLFARLADLYLDKGRTERALSLCEEGCANFPDYSTGFVVLSKCYEKQGEVEKAREAMGHALRLDPENPGSYKRLSRLFQQLGVAPLALQSLQQATHFDPFDESIAEQIDRLNYANRKEATQDAPAAEVVPLTEDLDTSPAIETSVEALIAGAPEEDSVNEVAEPFAQVQNLPEWSESPNVGDALKEFDQGPNPLFTEDGVGAEATEPTAQPETGQIEELDEVAVSGTPSNPKDGRSDAVAALGFEIFGGKMPEATEAPPDVPESAMPVGSDETASNSTDGSSQTSPTNSKDDLDTATVAVPPRTDDQDSPDGEETGILGDKKASTLFLVPEPSLTETISAAEDKEAEPQVNSPIHFTEKKETDAEETPNVVSIFSPDVLPEDSDIFRSQQSPDFVPLPTAEENTTITAANEDPVESAPTADQRAESPIAEAKAEAQKATETPTAEARTETQTLFLTTKVSEETTPAPRQETDSGESNLPASDVSTTEHDAVEEQNTVSAATEIPAATDEQSGDSPIPFRFRSPSDTTAPAETDDLSLDDYDLPKVTPESDRPVFFSPGSSEPTADTEEDTERDKSIDPTPASRAETPSNRHTFLSGTTFSGLKERPQQPNPDDDARAPDSLSTDKPLGPVQHPEGDPVKPEPWEHTHTSFLPGSAITGSKSTGKEEKLPDPKPIEEIPDSASSKVSETESAPLENSEAFADPAYADDSTTGTPIFFLSSSEADATDGPIESPSDSPATELTDTAPSADDPSVGQSNPELLRLFREIESEPEIGTELEIGAERKPVTPPPALKPGHPEDKRIATMTLAEIYTIQGLTQKAIETYRELLEQNPNNTIIRDKLESLEKSSGK